MSEYVAAASPKIGNSEVDEARDSGEPKNTLHESAEESKLPALMSVVKVIAGNGGYVVLGFVANMASANGLSPAQFGLVAVSLAVLNVLQEICGNGVDLAMVRLAAPHVKNKPNIAAGYYSAALRYKLAISIGVACILYLLAPALAHWAFSNPQMTSMLRWVCLGLIGAALYNYALSRMQAEERFGQYAILRVLNNVAKLIMLGGIWFAGMFNPEAVLSTWILAFFIGYVMALMFRGHNRSASIQATKAVTKPPNADYFHEVFHFSKWLVCSSFLFCLYSRTDMLILARYVDIADIGQYAAAWNITFIIDLMTYSVIVALLPRATQLSTTGEFRNYMRHTFVICAVICLMLSPLYFLAEFFFDVFFPAYTESASLFRILLSGALITLLFHPLYLILYTRNRVNRLTIVNALLVVFILLLGLSVIPGFGTQGAAWVTVAGRVFASLLILFFVYSELKSTAEEHNVATSVN